MACHRCHGLMVENPFINMGVQENGEHLWLRTWRCLNCGNVVEPTIRQRRLGPKSARTGHVKRSTQLANVRINGRPLEQKRVLIVTKQENKKTGTLITVKEVAVYLGVTTRTVYRLLEEHGIPALKVGGQWRFRTESIEAWLQGTFRASLDQRHG